MSTFYLDYENGNDSTTATPLGWWSVAYTTGNGTEPVTDESVEGGTSGSTAYVSVVVVSSGTWAGGDAAGTIYWYGKSDAFESETLTFDEGATCSIGGDFTYCAWKTITSGATAARIAPGDEIRIAKSPAPSSIGNATWTNLSKTVTLASAQTLTVDNCETAWTANGSGDCTVTRVAAATDAKQGDYCMKFALDASVQTGVMQAYYEISETNFSSYQKLSFWIKNEAAIADGESWYVCLCSDTAGATVVDTFKVPAIPSTAQWLPLTITKTGGGNLGSVIKSIAVWTGTTAPTASKYIYLDNIIACTTSGLNLQSLISKNTLEQSTVAATSYGNEGWYGIQSINGVTVLLDGYPNYKPSEGKGYYGATETVTTYKRETIKTSIASASGTVIQAPQDSGTDGNEITYSGGWDTATSLQIGETFFDGLNGYGYGLSVSKQYLVIEHLSFIRCVYGIYQSSVYAPNYYGTISDIANCWGGLYIRGSNKARITCIINIHNNGGEHGLYIHNSSSCVVTQIVNINSNSSSGIYLSGSFYTNIDHINNVSNNVNGINISYDANYTIINTIDNASYNNYAVTTGYYTNCHLLINNLTSSNNTTSCVYLYSDAKVDHCYINKLTTSGETLFSGGAELYFNNRFFVTETDGTASIFYIGGLTQTQDTTRHTASGVAWQMSPTSNARNSSYPLELSLAKVKVNSSAEVTVTCYCKLSHATDVGAKLICKGGQIAGVTTDVTDTKAEDTDWEQLSISFTPTEGGVVEIIGQGYWRANTADDSIYWDDFNVVQA